MRRGRTNYYRCPTCNQDSAVPPKPRLPRRLPATPAAEAAPLPAPATEALALLRARGVSEAALALLAAHRMVTPEAIMAAHLDGLAEIGLEPGPERARVVQAMSALRLADEDERVLLLLEERGLGKYRARLAADQFDVEALRFFLDQEDRVLKADLGLADQDLPAFRMLLRAL